MSLTNFGPRKQDFQDILITSLGALLAGVIGGLIIFLITFLLNNIVDIKGVFTEGSKTSASFPIILAFVTFIGTTICSYFTYSFCAGTDPDGYKKNIVIFGQLALIQLFIFVFLTPIYLYIGLLKNDFIMAIFVVNIIISVFATNLVMDLLNNYRYILVSIYGNFLGLFVSTFLIILIFSSISSSTAKLVSLVIILPIVNFFCILMKKIFEMIYYAYYKMTSLDQIGDIFFQIELEEKEKLKELEEKNSI